MTENLHDILRRGIPVRVYPTPFRKGGAIHINPKNRGKFTASAKAAGRSVQEHARAVLADPKASPLQKKRANFARNASRWKHEQGGSIGLPRFRCGGRVRKYVHGGTLANAEFGDKTYDPGRYRDYLPSGGVMGRIISVPPRENPAARPAAGIREMWDSFLNRGTDILNKYVAGPAIAPLMPAARKLYQFVYPERAARFAADHKRITGRPHPYFK
jgi:hypothetical protein